MSYLESALQLAALGYRVFPLEPNGKRPVIKGWPDLASTDEAAIRRWWADWPDANIGVATGRGLLVLDCDCKPTPGQTKPRPGLESLAVLDMMGLPGSMRVSTPSGGVHVYLACSGPRANSVDELRDYPGIDVRADGGYVVAPGSTIGGVPYAVQAA